MKGVRPTPSPLLPKGRKWKADRPVLDLGSVPPSHDRSLYAAIDDTQAEPGEHHGSPAWKEEHQLRLVRLGERASRLAHDIRTPLASIECFASLLGRENHSQEERQALTAHCIRAVRSLDHLVSNMLVFGAPLQANYETVNLAVLLDEVELLAWSLLRAKRLTINRDGEDTVPAIWGQESLLKQSVLNLLMNAIHASQPDSVIEIHCRHESRLIEEQGRQKTKDGFLLRIQDHGCGMSEQERSRMFQPFYSNRKGGTGLGLAIVQQIVHLHHGMIDITSQQGKGTTVELFFPQ
ncbi:MAG: HAMP domain-containing histidine kinase [Nitrospirota bacterium]|nr:HAMP domain-containing histidine kinase [Nitrospirota bacterium]